jgi:hypothetical protein
MVSILFLIIAALNVALLVWAVRIARRTPSPAIWLVIITMALLWFDALTIGAGRWIGEGGLLLFMTKVRFGVHEVLTPLLIIAAGSIARLAGLRWARPKWIMGAFCLVAVAFIVMGVPHLFHTDFVTACYADTLRYVKSVSPNEICQPGQPMGVRGSPPIAAIACVIAMLGVGISLGLQRSWWRLAIGSFVMFVLAGLPPSKVGPVPSSIGEIIIFAAILATIVYFSRHRVNRGL